MMHTHKIYNTQSKSDWLFSNQSRALLCDWLILAKDEKATLNINQLTPNHMLSSTELSEISKIMHYGILIIMPNWY